MAFFCVSPLASEKVHHNQAKPKGASTIIQATQSLSLNFAQPPRRNANKTTPTNTKAMRTPLRQVSLRAL